MHLKMDWDIQYEFAEILTIVCVTTILSIYILLLEVVLPQKNNAG